MPPQDQQPLTNNNPIQPSPPEINLQPIGQSPPSSQQPFPSNIPQQNQQPNYQLNPQYKSHNLAIVSLILGIIAIPASILNILTLPIPILAIIFGIVSLKQKKNFAVSGIVLGIIGLILTAVIVIYGMNELEKRDGNFLDAPTTNESTSSGPLLDANCYSFNLPSLYLDKDIRSNKDCVSLVINSSSSEDVAVYSKPMTTQVSNKNLDEYLKNQLDDVLRSVSGVEKTGSKYIEIDGVRAYKVTGTQTKGNYKYFGMAVAVAPRDYISTTGVKLRLFLIANDSADNPNGLDEVIKTFKWK